jgi:endo-1,3-1,4-beta-glycanase ExoK
MVHPLLARVTRISPRTAGVISAFVALAVLTIAMSVYGVLAGEHKQVAAKATASHETPEQLAARDAEAAPGAPVEQPAPVMPPVSPEASVAPPPRGPLAQQGEAFIDHFRGADLHERWSAADGWSNGDWTENDWRASQMSFTPDGLRITLAKAPEGSEKPFMGGELRSNEFYRYGYFEARMRLPRDPGLVMGFFTYAGQDGKTRPHEIDIEILGRNTKRIELTLHQGGGATDAQPMLPFDAADGFHTYGFDWQPGAVRWYADGKLIHEETGGRAARITRPQQLMMSLWASRELRAWVGELDPSRAPWFLDIACAAYAPKYSGKPLCTN